MQNLRLHREHGSGGSGWLGSGCWGLSVMMVLLVKQVHLQKEGAASARKAKVS